MQETNECFLRDSASTLTFETQLNQLLSVSLPYAKTIVCLESAQCTLADVFLYWCGIASDLKTVLSQRASGIPDSVKSEVRAIFNTRWSEMFEDGPTDVHLAAVYLDPVYLKSDLFKEPVSDPPAKSDPGARIKHLRIFKRVGKYLVVLLGAEVEHGDHPLLHVPEEEKRAVKKRFFSQLMAYAQDDHPFSAPHKQGQTVLEWWEAHRESPHADILAALAIKIYSVMTNSMPDERTASIFTRLNSPVRNRMSMQAMVSQAQIQQFYHTQKVLDSHCSEYPEYYAYRRAFCSHAPQFLLSQRRDSTS
ncbi:uncharacterized protein C8Q71DRAFT_703094 [Rhodofomes roseus]|uniref:Uncharacterized protein n=1 Tax=Rhodofomes roseus TaxID=34475 RepID=A0ABQ8KNF7_9APHY|nr:uncharacterized protein C8Q71DRAFT_703094 [Rhodofomes roseus]KAH9839723.1 hypothetical protein C8Q71DRAFT_703094 [Rhodofomes roseus]